MSIVPRVDPSSAVAITSYLEQAKTWLATAVEQTGPNEIAAARAELATAAEATKQLHLSRDIQHDADEMVRRAEWALGRSIRDGQASGEIETKAEATRRATMLREVKAGRADQSVVDNLIKPKPTDFATKSELYKHGGDGILGRLAEASAAELEDALELSRADGNLSRANVLRNIKTQSKSVVTRDMRAEMIHNLAEQGYTSRQMVDKVGVVEETVRLIARDFGIEIPADKVVGRQRRLDHTAMVQQTVVSLSNEVDALKYIDFAEVDFSEADEWVASLNQSIKELRRFANRIKETTHV